MGDKERIDDATIAIEIDGVPWHSNQTSNLPEIYKQTASLEVVS